MRLDATIILTHELAHYKRKDTEYKEYGKVLLQILESIITSRLATKLSCMVDDKKNTEDKPILYYTILWISRYLFHIAVI